MFRRLDTEKAIQAIGVIVRCHPATLAGKLRVLKLLYIAERESIQQTGRPILGTKTVAMDFGPLHSAVLDLINGEHIDEPRFSEHFVKHGYMIQLGQDPGVGLLSRYEIEKLQEVSDRYASMSDWDLAHSVTHDFPEWKAHFRKGTSSTIPIESIVEGVGRSGDLAEIIEDLSAEANWDTQFIVKKNSVIFYAGSRVHSEAHLDHLLACGKATTAATPIPPPLLAMIREGAARSKQMKLNHGQILIDQGLVAS